MSILSSVFICLSVDRLFHHDSTTTVQEAVTTLYRCVAEIKMKEFEDGCGQRKGAGCRGVGGWEGAIAPTLHAHGQIWHCGWCDPSQDIFKKVNLPAITQVISTNV